MLKKLSIAAACGIAIYGLAKSISGHVFVVLDSTALFPFETMASRAPDQLVDARDSLVQDAAPRLAVRDAASEDNSRMCAEPSAVQVADPTREISWP